MDRKPRQLPLGFPAGPNEPRIEHPLRIKASYCAKFGTSPILNKISCFGEHDKTLIEKQGILLRTFLVETQRDSSHCCRLSRPPSVFRKAQPPQWSGVQSVRLGRSKEPHRFLPACVIGQQPEAT